MFRAYDIRGIYGSEVTREKFEALGRACNSFANEMVCGYDYRKHSKPLFGAFAKGFSGRIFSLGHAPTSAISFNAAAYGMVFTASHNPAEYAGAKFIRERHTAFDTDLKALEKEYEKAIGVKSGKNAEIVDAGELLQKYVETVPAIERGLFDLSGGAACAVKRMFPRTIFDVPDPLFEKHSPEPKDETLGVLKQETAQKKTLGFAFDGDADRCMLVDEGKVIDGGVVTAFLCESEFRKGDRIVVNIDFTDEVKDYLRDSGYGVIVCPVGTKHVVNATLENGAVLGAERNGHYYFPRHLPDSDGIYAAALLSQSRPGELLEFSKRFTHVLLTEAVKVQVDFEKLKQLVLEDDGVLEHNFMDGVYARFEDFTLLIRASQTEPKLRINSEAETREKAEKGISTVKALLHKSANQ